MNPTTEIVGRVHHDHPTGVMRRGGQVFTREPQVFQVTDEQLALIEADKMIELFDSGREFERAHGIAPEQQERPAAAPQNAPEDEGDNDEGSENGDATDDSEGETDTGEGSTEDESKTDDAGSDENSGDDQTDNADQKNVGEMDSMTVAEIKAMLDELGAHYDPNARKADLYALLTA